MNFWNQYGRWITGLAVLAILFIVLEYVGFRAMFARWFQRDLRPWLGENPVVAPIAFIAVYVVSVIVMIPGTIMTLAGGALFGPIWGTLYVSFGAVTGAGLSFLIARYVTANQIKNNAGDRLNTIKKGIERDGWQFVAITRLIPIFPFNLLNYAFGLTRINFWVHFWVSGIAMLPGTFAYVYAGYAGRELFAGEIGILESVIITASAIGVLIFIGLIPRWVRRFKDDGINQETDI